MATLRVAFLSALALELTAALATALVAVEIGLRLLAGHVGYQTALLVLLLTPEAYLPLRNAGAEFHASTRGLRRRGARLRDPRYPRAGPRRPAACPVTPTLGREDIVVRAVSMGYPGRDRPALDDINLTIRPGEHILLTGPSGAGKSSLLALLLGFVTPGSGTHRGGRYRPGPDPGRSLAAADRLGAAAPAPVRHDRGRQHRAGPARRAAAGDRGGRDGWPGPMASSGGCPGATTPS